MLQRHKWISSCRPTCQPGPMWHSQTPPRPPCSPPVCHQRCCCQHCCRCQHCCCCWCHLLLAIVQTRMPQRQQEPSTQDHCKRGETATVQQHILILKSFIQLSKALLLEISKPAVCVRRPCMRSTGCCGKSCASRKRVAHLRQQHHLQHSSSS